MSENLKPPMPEDASSAVVSEQSLNSGLSSDASARRRLIRAGLAAAPVMMALKSQSVLADDVCVKPSSFASLAAASMKLSAGRVPPRYKCFSHGFWKNKPVGSPDYKTNKFLSVNGFTANPGNAFTNMTLQGVLAATGSTNNMDLARHVVATYLTAYVYPDPPLDLILTAQQCRDIWNYQGVWDPLGGTNYWTLNQTMKFFNYVYGGTQPALPF